MPKLSTINHMALLSGKKRVSWDFNAPPIATNPSNGSSSARAVPSHEESPSGITTGVSQLKFESLLKEVPILETSKTTGLLAQTHGIARLWKLLGALFLAVTLSLCLGGLLSVALHMKGMRSEQEILKTSIIEQERKLVSEVSRVQEAMQEEMRVTRAMVDARLKAVDDTYLALRSQQVLLDNEQTRMNEKITTLSEDISQEKIARQNEMALLLNMSRVRINNIERRQQDIEKMVLR